jgi:hypothetical protein
MAQPIVPVVINRVVSVQPKKLDFQTVLKDLISNKCGEVLELKGRAIRDDGAIALGLNIPFLS